MQYFWQDSTVTLLVLVVDNPLRARAVDVSLAQPM
jgi:hypothetical protein